MTFREFKASNTKVTINDATFSMKLLAGAGLDRDHYARAVFELVKDGRLTAEQLDDWIARARSPRKRLAVKDEITAMYSPPAQKPVKVARQRRKPKSFAMVSRSDHERARKLAEKLGLLPAPAEGGRYRVTADTKQSSELTLGGFWMTDDG
jgi:hypothetical protein